MQIFGKTFELELDKNISVNLELNELTSHGSYIHLISTLWPDKSSEILQTRIPLYATGANKILDFD